MLTPADVPAYPTPRVLLLAALASLLGLACLAGARAARRPDQETR